MLKLVAERLMKAEVEALCGARYATRSSGRTNSRNGFRYRRWATDCGTIRLALPKLRQGHYYPHWLFVPAAERALLDFVQQCRRRGVSARRVKRIARELGVQGAVPAAVAELAGALTDLMKALPADGQSVTAITILPERTDAPGPPPPPASGPSPAEVLAAAPGHR
jgi:putative transposase